MIGLLPASEYPVRLSAKQHTIKAEKRMQATARMASVVSSPLPARRRLIRDVRPMKTLHLLKTMVLPSANTVGLSLLCVALFVAQMPFKIFGRGVDPSTQLYQDSKGSWVPAAEAHAHPTGFLIAAGVLGMAGVLLLAFSAASGCRRRRLLRKTK